MASRPAAHRRPGHERRDRDRRHARRARARAARAGRRQRRRVRRHRRWPSTSTRLSPRSTSRSRRKGEQAVELLLAVVDGEPPADIHRTLATSLIVRASTARRPTRCGHRLKEVTSSPVDGRTRAQRPAAPGRGRRARCSERYRRTDAATDRQCLAGGDVRSASRRTTDTMSQRAHYRRAARRRQRLHARRLHRHRRAAHRSADGAAREHRAPRRRARRVGYRRPARLRRVPAGLTGTLTVWEAYGASGSAEKDAFDKIVANVKTANPGLTVTVRTSRSTTCSRTSRPRPRPAAGPDLYIAPNDNLPTEARANLLLDVSDHDATRSRQRPYNTSDVAINADDGRRQALRDPRVDEGRRALLQQRRSFPTAPATTADWLKPNATQARAGSTAPTAAAPTTCGASSPPSAARSSTTTGKCAATADSGVADCPQVAPGHEGGRRCTSTRTTATPRPT